MSTLRKRGSYAVIYRLVADLPFELVVGRNERIFAVGVNEKRVRVIYGKVQRRRRNKRA